MPATYKAKKTAVAAPAKADDGEGEKPAADGAAAEETPAGMGRGARWIQNSVKLNNWQL